MARPLVYPLVRSLFYRVVRRRSKLLPLVTNLKKAAPSQSDEAERKWVLVYGAANHLGTQVSKVFAAHGYGLVLVDASLSKLQGLKAEVEQVFPHMKSGGVVAE